MITWMLYTLAASAVLCTATLLAERCLRVLALQTRWAWCACAAGILGFTAFTWRAPVSDAPFPSFSSRAFDSPAPRIATTLGVGSAPTSVREPVSDVKVIAIGVWIVLSIASGLSLAVARASLRRRRKTWMDDHVDGIAVKITDGLGPAVVGFIAPVIALPPWVRGEPPQRQRLIAAHEVEHVRAGDQWMIALLLGSIVLLPWNVLLWWAFVRAKYAIEIDCDARVTRGSVDVRAYAQLLIDVGGRVSRSFAFPSFAESPSALERRIIALTRTPPRNAVVLSTALSGAAILLAIVACEIPRPAGPGEARKSVSAAPPAVAVQDGPAPLRPRAAAVIDQYLDDVMPSVRAKGLPAGRAVWFIADTNYGVRKAWVGPAYSDAEFRRVALQPEYDTLLLGARHAERTAQNGASIPVVSIVGGGLWERGSYFNERTLAMIRDLIRTVDPSLLEGLLAGQAIYVEPVWSKHRVDKLWVGPLLPDARARWEYASTHYAEHVSLMTTPMNLKLDDGRLVPVVELHATPWARRYGD